ncbi:MAG: hypothetical protein K6T78_15330, partial [Alicyclobacillus sp.]|nr:hypothetical protein [Alicyclobacillus sp.]
LVIRTGTGGVVNETGFIMMMCNIYLLLVYGKLLSPPEERAAWASMAAARIEEKKRFKEAKAKVRQTKRDRRRAGGSAPQTGETEPTQTESVQ